MAAVMWNSPELIHYNAGKEEVAYKLRHILGGILLVGTVFSGAKELDKRRKVKKHMLDRFKKEFFDDRKKYGIVIDFFTSTLQRNDLNKVFRELADSSGYGDEYLGCALSTLYTEDEKDEEGYFEDGVLFYECDAKVIIDYPMYIKCMELAYKIYTEEYGEDEEIKRNLEIIKARYADK